MTSTPSGLLETDDINMILQKEVIRAFVTEAEKAYRDCFTLLGYETEPYSLMTLIQAARRGDVPRRGCVTRTNDGSTVTFHVHGMGYTFHDSVSGRELRFDARDLDGLTRLTFSSWDLQQYLKNNSNASSLESVEHELRRISLEWECLVHIHHELTSYFYCRSPTEV